MKRTADHECCWACGEWIHLESLASQQGICPACQADLDEDPDDPCSTVARQRRDLVEDQDAEPEPDPLLHYSNC